MKPSDHDKELARRLHDHPSPDIPPGLGWDEVADRVLPPPRRRPRAWWLLLLLLPVTLLLTERFTGTEEELPAKQVPEVSTAAVPTPGDRTEVGEPFSEQDVGERRAFAEFTAFQPTVKESSVRSTPVSQDAGSGPYAELLPTGTETLATVGGGGPHLAARN